MTKSETAYRTLKSRPEYQWRVQDVVEELNAQGVDSNTQGVSALLGALLKSPHLYPGVIRPERGVYYYSPNGAPPEPEDVFRPLVDAIPREAWVEIGMELVTTTKNGDRLVVDEKGTAWVVHITVEARLV